MSGSLTNCRRKVRCATSYDAIVAAWRMQFKNPYAKLNAYLCRYCDGWHIGNAYNRRDAKKALNRLARMMAHPNFFFKVPTEIRDELISKRQRMEGFLGGYSSGGWQAGSPSLPRWMRRRAVAQLIAIEKQEKVEFRGTSILP